MESVGEAVLDHLVKLGWISWQSCVISVEAGLDQ